MEWRFLPSTRFRLAVRVALLMGAGSLVAVLAQAQTSPDTSAAATPDTSAVAAAPVPSTPWSPGRQWITVRAGYAKSAVDNGPDGNVGAGFGFTRFGRAQWAIGVSAHMDLLGRFRSSAEVEVPMTFEVSRHYAWNTGIRPYLGLGGGAFYRKVYRTGDDVAEVRPGFLMFGGINAPISDQSLVGLDIRVARQGAASSRNPVFPSEDENAVHWSVKVTWSRYE